MKNSKKKFCWRQGSNYLGTSVYKSMRKVQNFEGFSIDPFVSRILLGRSLLYYNPFSLSFSLPLYLFIPPFIFRPFSLFFSRTRYNIKKKKKKFQNGRDI